MIFRHNAHFGPKNKTKNKKEKKKSTQNSKNPTKGHFVLGLCAKILKQSF